MIRHSLLLLLCWPGLVLILSACNPGYSPPAPTGSPANPTDLHPSSSIPPTTPLVPTAQLGAVFNPDHPVTITFAALEQHQALYTPLIEDFVAKNPGIRVQFIPLDPALELRKGFDPERVMRATAQAADVAANVFAGTPAQRQRYMQDLTPFIAADSSFNRNDFYPGALVEDSQDGSIRLLASTLSVPVFSYNKDLFAARGVPPPEPDWTWSDMKAAAQQLVQKQGDTSAVYGILDDGDGLPALTGELAVINPGFLRTSIADVDLTDQQVRMAVERVAALAQTGALYIRPHHSSDMTAFIDQVGTLVRTSQVGMWPGGLTPPGSLPFEVGTLPLPPPLVEGFGRAFNGYAMSSGTQHPEAAWRWMVFLSWQSPVLSEAADYTIMLPARRSVAERIGYWQRLAPETASALQISLARPAPPLAIPPVVQSLDGTLAAIMQGQHVDTVLQERQQLLEAGRIALQQTPQPDSDQNTIIVATPAPPTRSTGVTITFRAPDSATARLLADAFNKQQSQIVVEVPNDEQTSGQASLREVAATSDCFVWWGAPSADTETVLLDLHPLIDADNSFDLNEYPRVLREPFRQAGKLVGLPYRVDFRVLYYNPATFTAANLTTPRASWTLRDLIAAAHQLTNATDKERRYGFAALGGHTQSLLFVLDRFDAPIIQQHGGVGTPNFTDPTVVAAVQAYLDLIRATSPHQRFQGYTRDRSEDDADFLVSAGRVGMWFDESLHFDRPNKTAAQDATYAIAPPSLGNKHLTSNDVSVTTGLYISARTPHVEACWTWLKYLSAEASGRGGGFPARRSVAEGAAFLQQAPHGAAEVYAAYRPLLDRPAPPAPTDTTPIDYYWFYRAVDRALQGKNLEQELQEAQTLTEAHLACVRGGGQPGACARQVDPQYQGFAPP